MQNSQITLMAELRLKCYFFISFLIGFEILVKFYAIPELGLLKYAKAEKIRVFTSFLKICCTVDTVHAYTKN